MVSGAPAPLTQIGFRRDVRLFLTALVGFFATLILFLLVLLQIATSRAEAAHWQHWSDVADRASRDLDANADPATLRLRLAFLQSKFGIGGIELVQQNGVRVVSGLPPSDAHDAIERDTRAGRVRFYFDAPEVQAVRAMFRRTAIIVMVATAGGLLLLALYLPRITRPIEEMLDSAKALGERTVGVAEDRYLIDTFRSSIERLQAQEVELKRLHEAEKSRAEDLERITATLTRSLTSGFLAVDAAGNIVDVNAAARQILGLTPDAKVDGLTPLAALGERPFTAVLTEAFSERLSLSRREVSEQSGEQVIGLTTVPLQRDNNEFLGLLALFTDLTPIRQLETRVRQLQTLAELGEMSAGIAHEFRNSLAATLGYLRLAQKQNEPADIVERVKKAEDEAAALASAVDALLNFARPVHVERRRVDLAGLCRAVAERFDGAPARVTIHGEAAEIDGDPALLQRVFENVIRNASEAIEANGRDGKIEIELAGSGPVTVTVRDDGPGMSAEDAARAFVPFHSTKSGGFGLGLPLARKIVLLHGGDIGIESTAAGGTTVRMEFPAA